MTSIGTRGRRTLAVIILGDGPFLEMTQLDALISSSLSPSFLFIFKGRENNLTNKRDAIVLGCKVHEIRALGLHASEHIEFNGDALNVPQFKHLPGITSCNVSVSV